MTTKKRRKERILLYKVTHKLLCPRCEAKSARQLMIENMAVIPMLVKTKCSVCGYIGMLIEVPIELVSQENIGEKKKNE